MSIKSILISVKDKLKKGLALVGLLNSAEKVYVFLYVLLFCKELPLIWLDKAKDYEKGLLRRGQGGMAYGPRYVGGVQEAVPVSLPDINFYLFNKVRVSALSSSVIIDEKKIVIERAIGPEQLSYNFSSGHIRSHNQNTAVVHRCKKNEYIEKGIFLCGNGASNYYHWMVEILPRLEFVVNLPARYQKFPILVSDDVVSIPSFAYSLNIFAPGRETIVLDKNKSYIIDELIFITSPNNLPFNITGNNKFNIANVTLDNLSIDFIRKTVLANELVGCASESYPQKIFFCRKAERRNYNQDEVFALLSEFGFVKIFMEDLTFTEQVRTVYHAEFIVGPTGAAWTNLLFCRAGAKALCWMAEEIGNFSGFSTLACLVDVDLRYLTYKSGVRQVSDIYFQDYIIGINDIEKAMADFIKLSGEA